MLEGLDANKVPLSYTELILSQSKMACSAAGQNLGECSLNNPVE